MNKLTRVVTVGLLFFCGLTFAQKNNSIGIQFSNSKQDKFTIDYQFGKMEKLKFIVGASIGKRVVRFSPSLLEGDETYQLDRSQLNTNRNVNLKFGFNRQLKSSAFSIGSQFVVGYENKRINKYSIYQRLQDDGDGWLVYSSGDIERNVQFDEGLSSQPAVVTIDNVRLGLLSTLSADIPLGKRLLVNVNAGLYSGLNLHGGSRILENPLDEFEYGLNISIFEFYAQYGVGLRYIL